ncbi:hypothetical protein P7M42_25350, partial [Vibrio parahaemolyticus]|nr:hypothetical protein [Vibrio parahaemolyticus]
NVLYNRDSTVKQVTIKNMSVSKAMMLEELGQAQLVSEDDSSYIYRSDKYDFEFLTVDGITVDRMSVFSHIN